MAAGPSRAWSPYSLGIKQGGSSSFRTTRASPVAWCLTYFQHTKYFLTIEFKKTYAEPKDWLRRSCKSDRGRSATHGAGARARGKPPWPERGSGKRARESSDRGEFHQSFQSAKSAVAYDRCETPGLLVSPPLSRSRLQFSHHTTPFHTPQSKHCGRTHPDRGTHKRASQKECTRQSDNLLCGVAVDGVDCHLDPKWPLARSPDTRRHHRHNHAWRHGHNGSWSYINGPLSDLVSRSSVQPPLRPKVTAMMPAATRIQSGRCERQISGHFFNLTKQVQ